MNWEMVERFFAVIGFTGSSFAILAGLCLAYGWWESGRELNMLREIEQGNVSDQGDRENGLCQGRYEDRQHDAGTTPGSFDDVDGWQGTWRNPPEWW